MVCPIQSTMMMMGDDDVGSARLPKVPGARAYIR